MRWVEERMRERKRCASSGISLGKSSTSAWLKPSIARSGARRSCDTE